MSTTIEIVIAIIGTVIAVIEVIGEIRASRAEKREKMRMIKEQQLASEIIQKLKSIESVVDLTHKTKENITEFCGRCSRGDIQMSFLFDGVSSMLKCYSLYFELMDAMEDLYKKLVVNENTFSFSYGFSRYIDNFRELNNAKYDMGIHAQHLNLCASKLNKMKDDFEGGKRLLPKDIQDFYNNYVGPSVPVFFEDANRMICASQLINELKIRFGQE